MGREAHTRLSKQLSWLLRHGANEAGVHMDAAGWVDIREVLGFLRVTRPALDEAVEENTKSRLQIRGEQIRACQGHSTVGMPVTLEALESSWEEIGGAASIWHGTSLLALPSIAREGIVPQARTHVHLAEALDSRVGKRAQVDVMLEVSPERLRTVGIGVFRSPNGVVLVRHVPPAAIVGLEPMVEKARSRREAMRALFPNACG